MVGMLLVNLEAIRDCTEPKFGQVLTCRRSWRPSRTEMASLRRPLRCRHKSYTNFRYVPVRTGRLKKLGREPQK